MLDDEFTKTRYCYFNHDPFIIKAKPKELLKLNVKVYNISMKV